MKRTTSGFTIIELVIVISVIAILATLALVSYNGVTERAKTSQTTSAASQWLKALMSYRARNGGFPNYNGCLGNNYPYGPDGTATNVGNSFQCRELTSGSGTSDNADLNAALAPYISSKPTPAFVTAKSAANDWSRGIAYWNVSGQARFDITYSKEVGNCPSFNNDSLKGIKITKTDGNLFCYYTLGPIAGY